MRWLDRRGRPLPLEEVFAAQLVQVQRRAGLAVARVIQQRRSRRRPAEGSSIVLVRSAEGTRRFEGELSCRPDWERPTV